MAETENTHTKVLGSQAREIVFRIFNYFNSNKSEEENLGAVKLKVSCATGVSVRTIERIVKEGTTADNHPTSSNPIFKSPGKKRRKLSSVTNVPLYNANEIRGIIYNYHVTDGNRVTLERLRAKMREDIGWNGSNTSLRRILRNMGFRFRKSRNNRQVLIEKNNIKCMRIDYIQKIRYYRSQNRPIVYLDETYLHS